MLSGPLRTVLKTGSPAQIVASLAPDAANKFSVDVHERGVSVTAESDAAAKIELTCPQWGKLRTLKQVELSAAAPLPGLTELGMYGHAVADLRAVRGVSLDLRAAADASLSIDEVMTDELQLMAAGDAQVVLTGEATSVELHATGSAQVDASALRAQRVTLMGKGEATIAVWATAHLGGEVAPSVSLAVSGNPDRSLTESPATD